MDVNDTVHTVRLRFDLKMQLHSEKIGPCEWALRVDHVLKLCGVGVPCSYRVLLICTHHSTSAKQPDAIAMTSWFHSFYTQ